MDDRKAFLKALEANEDDITTRMVYADWLDERGEHEEADRQRKWPAAKEWLVAFANRLNAGMEEPDEEEPDEEEPDETPDSYREQIEISHFPVTSRTLVELGHLGVANGYIDCGNNEGLCYVLEQEGGDFWKNWSILTGVPVPDEQVDKISYNCAC